MPVGPFDGRKKRSRCLSCAASHLKCSGNLPCSNCQRKRVTCSFETQGPGKISIHHVRSDQKPVTRKVNTAVCKNMPAQLIHKPASDQIYYLSYYFDTFFQRNITNHKATAFTDVVSLMKDLAPDSFLHNAVLSLGAMQAVKLNSSEGISHDKAYRLAVYYYSRSVIGLKQALREFDETPSSRYCILWATHLLGLFELMTDATGQGWIQHLVHGTSKALVAAGPKVCQTNLGRRFFTEIQIFEVCRAIIFNEPTFLSGSEWRNLTAIDLTRYGDQNGLNTLLNIIVLCSTLRVRVKELLYPQEKAQTTMDDSNGIALEGFRLRQALIDWEAGSISLTSLKSQETNMEATCFLFLTKAFFAATSIYLSGVFDYEMPYWHEMGIVVPNLNEGEIQEHVNNILTHTSTVLCKSSISPLLVLFPLRVAGARSWQKWQRDCIMQSLFAVERTFPVASAFRNDLRSLWDRRSP